jgi:uncharacterized protein Usg
MADFEKQLLDYRLTTAKIIYHLPDFPDLLQEFIWQNYDLHPQFPELHRFLDFWTHELDGTLHSVYVAHCGIITPGDSRFYDMELMLH